MKKNAPRLRIIRILALGCLCLVLIACFAGPIHKHDSAHEACLICHVSHRANVVAIDRDAGKPLITPSYRAAILAPVMVDVETPRSIRVPRAPPDSLLPL